MKNDKTVLINLISHKNLKYYISTIYHKITSKYKMFKHTLFLNIYYN
jgi:hypothetical protein